MQRQITLITTQMRGHRKFHRLMLIIDQKFYFMKAIKTNTKFFESTSVWRKKKRLRGYLFLNDMKETAANDEFLLRRKERRFEHII